MNTPHYTAPESVSLATLYTQIKSLIWRLLDSTDRSTAIVHRSVVLADVSNEGWADVRIAEAIEKRDAALQNIEAIAAKRKPASQK